MMSPMPEDALRDPAVDDRDDRVLAPTRWIAWFIVPVLGAAFVILFGFPGRTEQLWAWTIQPEMTAVFMGSGYLAGSYFFVRVATGHEWHRVGAGLIAITVFATLLLGATLLHWDRFNHDHVSFWAWLALYVATPALLPWLWVTNRRTDPGASADVGRPMSPRLRRTVGLGGLGTLAVAGVLYVAPASVADAWPWPISPLTARTLAAFLAVPGVAWSWFLVEERPGALEILHHVVALAMVAIAVGTVLYSDSFRSGRLVPYLSGLVVALALEVALVAHLRRLLRGAPAGRAADPGA